MIYENKWCKIVIRGTNVVLMSKDGKYNDQYFTGIDSAFLAIGIKPMQRF